MGDNMKRNALQKSKIVLIIVLFLGLSAVPSVGNTISTGLNDTHNFPIVYKYDNGNIKITVQSLEDTINVNYHINDFNLEKVTIDEVEYFRIILEGESNIYIKGKPDLPNICRSIIIPDTLKMDIKVTNSEFIEYEDIQIAPSKGHIQRDIDPNDIQYEFDLMYNQNRWFPEEIAELGEPYILRDFRGQVVKINPFQYNPAEGKLRFYNDVTVEIYPVGVDSVNCIDRSGLPNIIDTDFMHIYERHFINFDSRLYNPVEEQGNMLVITYDSFWNEMKPFISWKIIKGVPIEMVNVSEIGDAYAIRNYISNYYDEKGLTFVLLVGDIAQIPTLYYGSGASDPSYSYVAGSDHYPDLFVGRFSAQNIGQLETQVERSIEYEKEPQIGADWYHKGTGIASNLGPGDDGEYDDEHIDNIRDDLLDYTYTLVDQIYDPYATSTQVEQALNEGRSVINYCGHGSATSWGTTGFGNSNVNLLTNDNMLPFIWSVACNNGEFDGYDTCFAEAWLRATHNGEPTGAIAAFMSSTGQHWDPPMDAQDEMVDILVESYANNKKNTFGGLSFNGCMHMNDEYGTYGWEMTDAWHVFGDPSLQVRTDTPTSMNVIHNTTIPIGATTFEVEVPGVEGALCAISRENFLFGNGYTNETGHAIIDIEFPLNDDGDITLVVTAYNKVPYIVTIEVEGTNEPPDKPNKPSGPTSGSPGNEYTYTSSTVDPEVNQVFYMWDWGDGNFSEWIGPYDSGEECEATYIWQDKGTYSVRVISRDIYFEESEWSDPLPVTMPKWLKFFNFLERFFPRLFLLISALLELIQN